METPKNFGSFPARYHLEDPPPGRAALDPNHSHFILVDDGTNEQFGKEIKLRAELEKRISEHKTRAFSQAPGSSVSIPVVLLALQGGPGTLESVYHGVSNNTPVVIVEGSGGAADILAYGFNHSKEEVVAVMGHVGIKREQLEEVLEAKIAAEFGGLNLSKNRLKQWTRWVVESIKKKQLLSIFEIDSRESTKNIDVAMLRALLRANKDDYQHQLKLALARNRSDIAETDIFTANRRWKQEELEDLMYSAILEDKVNFVKLFLENGISLRDFLTVRRLQSLYSEGSECGSPGIQVEWYPGYVLPCLYRINRACNRRNSSNSCVGCDSKVVEDPTRELFVFCVLLNRQEMAHLFWKEGEEGVAAALVGSKLLKSMAREVDTELREEILKHADKFEDLALGVLNACWGDDKLQTQLLLVRELYLWGELTCLRIAISGNHLKFIAHSACQALLNNIWMGKLALDTSLIRSGEVRKRVARIFREARARVDRIQRPSPDFQRQNTAETRGMYVRISVDSRPHRDELWASYARAGNEVCDLKNRRRLVADVKNTFRVSASFGRLQKIAGDPENSRDARRNIGRTTTLFTCIFIPPLVPALIYFREDQKEEETLIEPIGTDERHYSILTDRALKKCTSTTAEGEELDKSVEMVVVHSSGSGDPKGSTLNPAKDPKAARPECKSRSAPYRIPHGSRRETERAPDWSLAETVKGTKRSRIGTFDCDPDSLRTLGFMTPAGVYTGNMPSILINNRQTPQAHMRGRDEGKEEYEAPHTEEGELDFCSSGKRILTRFYLFYDAPITTFMHNVVVYDSGVREAEQTFITTFTGNP
ncbi:Transient receptor putative cation channel sub M member 2 [Branchiostoma belcheri]|nr:Transient receptor putative cation channel sub M member 2 [Branchiostoma belcheri]